MVFAILIWITPAHKGYNLGGTDLLRRIILPFMAALIIMIQFTSLDASASTAQADAEYLDALGLIRGTGLGYDLDAKVTRLQGAVMVVRLLGMEEEALAYDYSHPFGDVPAWGSPYVGYMYSQGLTKGKGDGLFGSYDLLTEAQYMTFLLRILGYSDSEGDFKWYGALDKARSIGMVTSSSLTTEGEFLRSHMMGYTVDCLETRLKDEKILLYTYLQDKGKLSAVADTAGMIYAYETGSYSKSPMTAKAMQWNLELMMFRMDDSEVFDISRLGVTDYSVMMADAMANAGEIPGYGSVTSGYRMTRFGDELTVTIDYKVTAQEIFSVRNRIRSLVDGLIEPDMTPIERELLIHDYIVNHVAYDTRSIVPDSAYTLVGALNEGKAVCQGYAEAFQLMAYYGGLHSRMVFGEAASGTGTISHAWNLVEIEGSYYHLDTTWDDPVMTSGEAVLSYAYFNLDDEAMSRDHYWDRSSYPAADALAYNYYVYNHQVVYSQSQLRTYIQEKLNSEAKVISVKVIGESLSMEDLRRVLDSCYGFDRILYRLDGDSNVVTIEKV